MSGTRLLNDEVESSHFSFMDAMCSEATQESGLGHRVFIPEKHSIPLADYTL